MYAFRYQKPGSVAAAAAGLLRDGDARLLAGGQSLVAAMKLRVTEMERALAANWSPEALAGIIVPAGSLNADMHASAEYRAHLVTVMARRAVEAAK